MVHNTYYLKALLDSDSKVIATIYRENFYKVKSFVLKNNEQALNRRSLVYTSI